jgi:hypothetical protein
MFAKHSPYLRNVIPFGDDPYDSVGSFACVVGALLAAVSLVRAFYPYRGGPETLQLVYLFRSLVAVPLAMLITAAADLTAMARYPQQLFPSFLGYALLGLIGFGTLVTLAVLQSILAARPPAMKATRRKVRKAWLALALGMLLLALTPRSMLQGMASHLVAIILGAAVLFAPMRFFLLALIPDEPGEKEAGELAEHPVRAGGWRRWSVVIVLGVLVGVCAFVGELAEHTAGIPLRQLLFVGSVYTGIGLSGIVLAYLFLGMPLGFSPRR